MPDQSCVFDKAPGSAAAVGVDWWVLNDAASADAVARMHGKKLKFPEKVKVFIDHDTPCGSAEVAVRQKALIRFTEDVGCELFNGRGISHQIMLDRFAKHGDVVAGCFTHRAMYGAAGALGVSLSPEELARSMENGAASFVVPQTVRIRLDGALAFPASGKDLALFLRSRSEYGTRDARVVFGGKGAADLSAAQRTALCQMLDAAFACFDEESVFSPDFSIDLSQLGPVVAGPGALDNAAPVGAFSGVAVNEVFIGGCSGGRIEDLRLVASILDGRRVPPRVRLMAAPATTEVYCQAAAEGLWETFLDAGAILMNQGCSVCWGKSQGIVDDGEVLLSTGSHNHKGCAGSESAETHLCSPAVAAYSALAGTICGGEI